MASGSSKIYILVAKNDVSHINFSAVFCGLTLISADCYDCQTRTPTSSSFSISVTGIGVPALPMTLSEITVWF